MKIRRLPFSFVFLLALFLLTFVNMFRHASEEKLLQLITLKNSPLPIISIQTDAQKPIKSKENYRRCDAYLFADFAEAFAYVEQPAQSEIKPFRARIRGRGNSTWTTFDTNKRSYLLKLDDASAVFGMPSAQKWILQGNVTDKTSLRNAYAYHLGASVFDRTGWTPKTQFVNLFINGKFLGLYLLMEKAEIEPHRLNLPTEPADESFLTEVNSRLNRAWNFRSNKGVCLSIREKTGAEQDYYRAAETVLQDFEEVLFSEDFMDSERGYRAYIDLASFVDWYLVNEYTKNHDARFQDSCFLFYDSRDRLLHMGPLWDFDIACGNNTGACADPEELFIQSRFWFARLWEDPFFREKVAERWADCHSAVRQSLDWITEQATLLETDANLDDKIWQRFGYRQWPNAPGYKQRKTYQAEVDYMTDWLTKRIAWLDSAWL